MVHGWNSSATGALRVLVGDDDLPYGVDVLCEEFEIALHAVHAN